MSTENENTEINFVKVVLEGYSSKQTEALLSDYYYRQFQNAKSRHYGAHEFFSGCIDVVKALLDDIDQRYYHRKAELAKMLTLTDDPELIAEIKDEIKSLQKGNFLAFLPGIFGNLYVGNLSMQDVGFINSAIAKALDKVSREEELKVLDAQANTSGHVDTLATEGQGIEETIKEQIQSVGEWEELFASKRDYQTFIDALTSFFSGNTIGSSTQIRTKSRTKSKNAEALRQIYKALKPTGTLKHDTQYLELAKSIDCFKAETDVYKALTRTR